MKKILMPIKSEEVYMILNGEKTVKILKNAAKCNLPIVVYIYCTKSAPYLHPLNEPVAIEPGGPQGTNKVAWKKSWHIDKTKRYMSWNGKVVAKFTLKKVKEIKPFSFMKMAGDGLTEKQKEIADKACIGWLGISKYANGKSVYLWYIDDLVIFNEPKKLEEFYGTPKKINGLYGPEMVNVSLSKAPCSWRYVEELEC